MSELKKNHPGPDYTRLLAEVKDRVRSAQYAALKAVNTELVGLYWDIGRMIVERQAGETWGKAIVQQLAGDLQREFPGVGGFSASNLWRMKAFFEAYAALEKLAPLAREIGWSHNLVIIERCSDPLEREFYIRMQFYLTVLDRQVRQVRQEDENPSIGIILCKEKNRTIVEYALHDARKPIGVATYEITKTLPRELRGQLPQPEEIADLLEGIEEDQSADSKDSAGSAE